MVDLENRLAQLDAKPDWKEKRPNGNFPTRDITDVAKYVREFERLNGLKPITTRENPNALIFVGSGF